MGDSQAAWTSLDYAVIDVEGNGQQPPDLVEIAIVPISQGAIGPAESWLVRPPRPITSIARRFHRIADEEVAAAPSVADIAPELRAALDGRVLVAHNANVDLGVVARELPGYAPSQVVDTLKLARRLLPGRPSYRLGALVEELNLADGLPNDLRPHRATYDAIVCARLFVHVAVPVAMPPLTVADLTDTSPNTRDSDETNETLF